MFENIFSIALMLSAFAFFAWACAFVAKTPSTRPQDKPADTQFGVRESMQVLKALKDIGPMNPTQLAATQGTDPSKTEAILNHLAKSDYVRCSQEHAPDTRLITGEGLLALQQFE